MVDTLDLVVVVDDNLVSIGGGCLASLDNGGDSVLCDDVDCLVENYDSRDS